MGYIAVGKGTAIKIYLPALDENGDNIEVTDGPRIMPRVTETVLAG